MLRHHRNLSALVLALTVLLLAIFGCRSTTQRTPSWTKAKVLADNEDHPSKLISDGRFLFYVTGGTLASKNEGTNNIKRIDLKSGSISVVVKGGERIPNAALAVDESFSTGRTAQTSCGCRKKEAPARRSFPGRQTQTRCCWIATISTGSSGAAKAHRPSRSCSHQRKAEHPNNSLSHRRAPAASASIKILCIG